MVVQVEYEEGATVFDDTTVPKLLKKIAKAMRPRLRKSTFWPVDTGRSRAGMLIKRDKSSIQIGNKENYAPYVRRKGGVDPTESTVVDAWNDAARKVEI